MFVPLEDFLGVQPAFGGEFVNVVTSYYLNGGVELFDEEAESEDEAYTYASADPDEQGAIEDVDGQFRLYMEEPYDKVRWTFAPPVLMRRESRPVHRRYPSASREPESPVRKKPSRSKACSGGIPR